ncbi:Oxidoreductase molybdopterin binding domain protein [Methyloligella halotolerans]|uniref:Oxidoreductase molybdopterin binding domain protein n=1 Tax=Methyloligella halotolerans TaxID=1177755 RepID=A0A1E2RXT4_9HYPH|nr:sulfite dehydrogenase [Methyloligella halotolerans]ODA67034.1 Oxidoreductase molybdopterin binding domain protein [Methyloligella halotolerans]
MTDQRDNGSDEECPCQEGMFPKRVSRRNLLAAAAGGLPMLLAGRALAEEVKNAAGETIDVPADPTKVPGRPVGSDGGYGSRSPFETEKRLMEKSNPSQITSWSYTPLATQIGNMTPSGLHYERHHGGIPTIDPARHDLFVHGMVEQPKKFSMAELKRMPSITRKHFMECSGNTLTEWKGPNAKTVQVTHGLLSTSEWTGVPFSYLAREIKLKPGASWVLAEGADAAVMTRSIPLDKMLKDAFLAYGQNGEAIRPEQGYPLRLVLPGYEGNMNIKWIRRLEISDRPYMTREETSKYTGLNANGIADQFFFGMEAKSVITFPSGDMKLPGPGHYEIAGLAWSGNGRVRSVEVSLDGGKTWYPAHLDSVPEPMCTVRFTFPWRWDGKPAVLASRCIDETGMSQPTRDELVDLHGLNHVYHYNAIQNWAVAADGGVTNV